jgi:hypothetical protein
VDLKAHEDEEVEEEVEEEGDVAGSEGSSDGSNGVEQCSLGVTATLHAVMPPPHLPLGKQRGEASGCASGQVPAALDFASDRYAARLLASASAKVQM